MALRHLRAAASGIEVDFLYPKESTMDGSDVSSTTSAP